jgi:hypothetical protein
LRNNSLGFGQDRRSRYRIDPTHGLICLFDQRRLILAHRHYCRLDELSLIECGKL